MLLTRDLWPPQAPCTLLLVTPDLWPPHAQSPLTIGTPKLWPPQAQSLVTLLTFDLWPQHAKLSTQPLWAFGTKPVLLHTSSHPTPNEGHSLVQSHSTSKQTWPNLAQSMHPSHPPKGSTPHTYPSTKMQPHLIMRTNPMPCTPLSITHKTLPTHPSRHKSIYDAHHKLHSPKSCNPYSSTTTPCITHSLWNCSNLDLHTIAINILLYHPNPPLQFTAPYRKHHLPSHVPP